MNIKHQHLACFITAWYVFFAAFWLVGIFSLAHYEVPMWMEWPLCIFRSIIVHIADGVNVEFGNIPGGFACVTIFAFAAASIFLLAILMLRLFFCNHSSLRCSPASAAPPPQPSPPSGGPTSAAQAAPSLGVFYYFLGTAALFLSLFLFYMVERITYGVCTYQGFVPVGLAILFRFRYCLGIVLLVLFALGALANRSRLLRMPVTMACAAIATLCLFFFASLLLVTPVIAVLPIDYDLDKSGPFRISKDVRLQESLANNEELLASFNDFHLTTGRQERIKSAVSIQKDCDNILCHRGIIASPDEVRRLLGEPNEIYSTAPCASNSWYYWISPESRTNGFLNIWWHTRLSKRTNRLAGIFVATFAPEESD